MTNFIQPSMEDLEVFIFDSDSSLLSQNPLGIEYLLVKIE